MYKKHGISTQNLELKYSCSFVLSYFRIKKSNVCVRNNPYLCNVIKAKDNPMIVLSIILILSL